MADLKALLMMRECKGGKPALEVYKDSLGVLTVGIGHKVVTADKLKLKDKIEEAQVDKFFAADTAKAVGAAKGQAAQAKIQDGDFQVYLASVNFQLGTHWTSIHKKTWELILEGKYAEAAEEVGKSKWASQTPVRVQDFQEALLALPPGKAAKSAAGTGMERADMKRLLSKARKRAVNCAVGLSADAKDGLLLLDLITKPRALSAELGKEIKGARNLRWGTARVDPEGDPKLVVFTLNRRASGLARKLRKTLRGTGFAKAEVGTGEVEE